MILLEFIRIYNKLTEEMGFVKLIKVYEHSGVEDFDFTSEFIYGSDIFMRETYRLEKLVDINSLPDYNKFIMNKKELIVQRYFYLNYGNIDNVHVRCFENVVNVEKLNLLNKYDDFSDEFDSKPNINLFSKCIRAVFFIKKNIIFQIR